MQKQEDEKLERRLHQVMERIQPDEDAKDRMYLEIMRRASVAETPPAKPKPWYLRWQTSAGACTAALLCVVVVAAAVHGRMPQGGTGQLDVVSPTVTTQASELPADTAQPDETADRNHCRRNRRDSALCGKCQCCREKQYCSGGR